MDEERTQDAGKLQVNSAKLASEKNKLGARSKKLGELVDESNIKPFDKNISRAKSPNLMMQEADGEVIVKKRPETRQRQRSLKSTKKSAISKS